MSVNDEERLERALRNAHNAGDTAAAQRLATELRNRRAAPARAPEVGPEAAARQGLTEQLNRGIAGLLGAPVDIVNTGLGLLGVPVSDEPFLGSRNIGRGLETAGVRVATEEPETVGQHMARGLGEAAGALLPLGAGLNIARQVGGPVTAGMAGQVSQEFARAPIRATGAELAAGAGAGLGGASFEGTGAPEEFRPYFEIGGALAGGASVPAAARAIEASPVVGGALRWAEGQLLPFTERGARERARTRVRGLTEDPEAARAAIATESEAGLSPAVQTGEPRLMALERVARDTDPQLDLRMRQAEENANQALQQMTRAPAQGVTADVPRAFISRRVDDVVNRLDERVQQAGQRAQERLAAIEPQRRPSESSIIVREELDNALTFARGQERELWDAVPQNAIVPTANARQTYNRILDETPIALRDDIPSKAQLLTSRIGATDTVREVYGLYSAMRAASRRARADGEMNSARISDEIADAILVDLGATDASTEAGRLINEARAFSLDLNQRFRQGAVGRVLGYSREGGDAMPAERTLESLLGAGGTRGAVGVDQLRRGVETPLSEGATQDFLLSRFEDQVVRQGAISPERAASFFRQNAEVLDRFPQLRTNLEAAVQQGDRAALAQQIAQARASAIQDPNISAAQRFIDAPVYREIDAILSSQNPGQSARQLWRIARRDETGRAQLGLKGAFIDSLMARARASRPDTQDRPVVSGDALRRLLNEPQTRDVSEVFLTADEQKRLSRIVREFRNVDRMQGSLPSVGTAVIEDPPNNVISFLARTLAARQGARAGQGVSGASLLTANFASQRMQRLLQRLTNDQAEALIRQAVAGDRELFDALLAPANIRSEQPSQRIIESLIGFGATQIGEEENDRLQ